MKTFKLFFMAALALMMAACSSEDNDITTATQKSEGVKFTATISAGNSSVTRALSEDGNTIVATWAVDEEVELIYTIGETTHHSRARVTAVTEGKATIEGTLEDTPTGDTPVTLIYPAVVANGTTGNVLPGLLLRQEGTLANIATTRDVRKGTGTLTSNGTTATLKTAVTMENQYAIWKITTPASANQLCIMADNTPIAGASLNESGTVFYVAVPAVSSKTITVVATDESNNCYYYSKAGVSLAASKYYKSDLSTSMTTLDEDNTKSVYKISATNSTTIPADKTVVFSEVNIDGGNITCGGNATIILMGMNNVSMYGSGAGIQAGGEGTTLTITGTGMLTATGYGGAGIGACDNATCGNIVIRGGEMIMATGYNGAAGIGTGLANGGNSICGDILISGGSVTAAGGSVGEDGGGAGIGAGFAQGGNTTCGTITITSGVIEVMAGKGITAANSIGAGTTSGGFSSTSGTVTIEDGANVTQY